MDDDTKRRREALRKLKLGYDRVDLGEPDPALQRRSKKKADDTAVTSAREITLSLPTSWDFLKAWLNRYAVGHPITGVNNLNFKSRQTRALMNGMEFKATVEGAYQGDIVLPLIEFAVFARDVTCDVTARCNEPGLAGYFRHLLLAIAEQWPEMREVISKYVAKLPETQIQPSLESGNADLAELNSRLSAAAMKGSFGRYHPYDPQRLLYILNRCLSPAHDACEFDLATWMSQGQKYIMLQSPGVEETELSRYLSNARKNGLLEWRGVPLPGRPLTK